MVSDEIVIVSGLPRSGTSMMMKMLVAGGIEPLTDEVRKADEDNPRGYFEYERVKKIKEDQGWLPGARGRAVKMISMLLQGLPRGYEYRVIFMRRDVQEVLSSQRKMLERLGKKGAPEEQLRALYARHLAQTEGWLAGEPNIKTLYVAYGEAIEDAAVIAHRVNEFLGGGLDEAAMAATVERSLYRNRGM